MLFSKASIARAVDAALPEGMIASEDTIEEINKSCAEFVNLLSTQAATEALERSKHPVMSQKDVVDAIKSLGLEAYLSAAEGQAAADVEKAQARRQKRKKPKKSKEEEAAAAEIQQELLEATAKSFYSEQDL